MATNEKLGTKSATAEPKKENFVTKTIKFFEKNQKWIYGILIGILMIAVAIVLLNRFYFQPKMERGSTAILKPIEFYTQAVQMGDSALYTQALEGDEENDGFLTIISQYKWTSISNTAKYFAGLCYLNTGDEDEALKFFKEFKHKEDVYWHACQMLIGDIYDNQNDTKNAIKYYEVATESKDPYFTPIALFKLGQQYERDNNWKKAIAAYEQIENNFNTQYMNMGVDKFLERAKIKAN
ncbi:MAG: tetratricopeptide repeat protein [Bacteroidales bacterium]|jgi:tetratricopeptide (TPR) repeat protein|nr:tetratricopeptide repeat protein [Bacteroidales bacterium]